MYRPRPVQTQHHHFPVALYEYTWSTRSVADIGTSDAVWRCRPVHLEVPQRVSHILTYVK